MSHFDFKQFKIFHDRSVMKVGTDGVLLGAWANVAESKSILDIGTGTGLIAIMLAQRCEADITGIDIDSSSAEQAQENISICPFHNSFDIYCTDLASFHPDKLYDNIVSNPPYYTEDTLPPNKAKSAATHTADLTFETLIAHAKRLLAPNGLFQVIIPFSNVNKFSTICTLNGLSLLKRTDVCTKTGKPYKRTLLCFINNIEATQPQQSVLSLANATGERSDEYKALTKEYYL